MIRVDTPAEQEEGGIGVLESPLDSLQDATGEEWGPARIAHVVDFYRRYPGETVIFYTRLDILEPLADLTLRISLPMGLILSDYQPPSEWEDAIPEVEVSEQSHDLAWTLTGELSPGTRYEFRTEARVAVAAWDQTIESRAVITNIDHVTLAEETVSIAVVAKGRYLRFLPALYEKDDLMGRFLMLFESFWAPIEQQVDSISCYFDPKMTPTQFLPWLASWLDLELDERWSETKLRNLIRWAIVLHRSRGTRWGLLKYLQIYTGVRAEITEYRSHNFILGPGARLGPGIALGRGNVPHTFRVTLRLPPIEVEDKEERIRQEQIRRRTIESIIEMQKPAHTVYTLDIQTISAEDLKDQVRTDQIEEDVAEVTAQDTAWFKPGESGEENGRPAGKKTNP